MLATKMRWKLLVLLVLLLKWGGGKGILLPDDLLEHVTFTSSWKIVFSNLFSENGWFNWAWKKWRHISQSLQKHGRK